METLSEVKFVPRVPTDAEHSWQKILAHKHKLFFSGYVHVEPGLTNDFFYQNSGEVPEEIMVVLFHLDGKRVMEVEPLNIMLQPAEALSYHAADELRKAGYTSFCGSIMHVAHPLEVVQGDDLSQRDYAGLWMSDRHGCHIGIGAMTKQNVTGEKEKKTYNMFCPAVFSSKGRKTIVTLFNHSTEPGYCDTVAIEPVLANLKGEKMRGRKIETGPWGSMIIDVDDVFGEEGRKLLAKTGGRGSVTAFNRGNTFITTYFHVDKNTNEIVSGTHTIPASIIVYAYGIKNPYLELLAERVPGIYLLWKLKHFRESNLFVNFYPPRPLFLPSLYAYLKQSRWILQITYILRALYLLTRRGFKITTIENADAPELKHVVDHNLWRNFNIFQFSRARIERLMYLLILARANLKGKTLSIGPRNEGEILLFYQHGFTDVVGADLFSYSPYIKIMDAHRMTFHDNTFDTVNCGWVFTYVHDLKKVISEIIRVSKDGALIACAYTVPSPWDHVPAEGTNMANYNISQILEMFSPHVDHVYWRDDSVNAPHTKQHLVFRLKK
jgi:SAM-dependent methyltransferase